MKIIRTAALRDSLSRVVRQTVLDKEGNIMNIQICKNVKEDAALRHSFNALAGETFGLDFEPWYQYGYWGERYIPYCAVHEGQVVANVSVNLMDFSAEGSPHRFLQLGTVMTKPAFRRQGLCRRLMEEIEKDWTGYAQGTYLFANNTVLDFYPRFGFTRMGETKYTRSLSVCRQEDISAPKERPSSPALSSPSGSDAARKVNMDTKEGRDALWCAVRDSADNGSFAMRNNPGLVLFYATSFMKDQVYYRPEANAYVIAEVVEDTLCLDGIFSPAPLDPLTAALALGSSCSRLELGFAPSDPEGYETSPLWEDDDALFVNGEILLPSAARFPILSHA